MIPDVPELRKTLNEIFLDEIEGDRVPDGTIKVCGPPDHVAAASAAAADWNNTTVVLRLGGKTKIGLVPFLEKMRAGMEAAGHSHCSRSSPVAHTLAAILTACVVQAKMRFDLLTSMKDNIGEWKLSTWALLPKQFKFFPQRPYCFGDFHFGILEFEKLEEACKQIGTDAFSRVRAQRQSHFRTTGTVSRVPTAIKAITFSQIPQKLLPEGKASGLMNRIIEEYFLTLFEAEKSVFLRELDAQQGALVVAGLGSMAAATLQSLSTLVDWVACFHPPNGQYGWGLSQVAVMKVELPSSEKLEDRKLEIEKGLKIHDWMTREIDARLQVFSEYFLAAEEMSLRNRMDEATLHLVFALDLLLGGKAGDALTKVLASRVAMLTHSALGLKFEEQRNFIEESYDLRSGYVHRGLKFELSTLSQKSGDSIENRFRRLVQTSRVLFAAGCFARQQAWCSGSDAHDKWLRRVDLLSQTQLAGKPLREDDVNELGIYLIRSKSENSKAPLVSVEWDNS